MTLSTPEFFETSAWTTRLASLVSWWGTTAASLAQKALSWELWDVRTVVFIASKDNVGAIEKAQKMWIPVEIVDPKNPADILRVITKHKVQLVFQNGWLPKTPEEVIAYLEEHGILAFNQHPGDLREDGNDFWGNEKGKWMYGSRVTAARILYLLALWLKEEDVFTSSSVHTLTKEVDGGALVGARKLIFSRDMTKFRRAFFDWLPDMSMQELMTFITSLWEPKNHLQSEKRATLVNFVWHVQWELLKLEHENVAEVVSRVIAGKMSPLPVHPDYKTPLVPWENLEVLSWAKSSAVKLYPKG